MQRLREQQITELARKITFPPLNITSWKKPPTFQSADAKRKYRPDAVIEICWENKPYLLIAEIAGQASPKLIEQAIHQVKKYVSVAQASNKSTRYYPLLIAPYLSEERLELLIAEQISGLDLSGNGVVIVPGKIFVYRSGAANKFPSNALIKNVFRGVSSIVPCVFFAKPEYASVNEVWQAITERSGTTTLATVSKVLKTLGEELLIARTDEGIRLLDGNGLLKNLRTNYRRPAITQTRLGKVADLPEACAKMVENAKKKGILWAMDETNRYAVMPSGNAITRVYAEDINKLLTGIELRQTDRFANLELIETREPTIYFDRRREPDEGVYYISPLQVYLELASGGKREQDTAEKIAAGLLKFRY